MFCRKWQIRKTPNYTFIEKVMNYFIIFQVNKVLNSWEEMCSDLSVFKSVISIPANTTVDPADLQTKICGVYINYTKLYEELLAGVDGLPELFEAVSCLILHVLRKF